MAKSINIRFPIEDNPSGVFATNSTTERALRDLLIILLTTKRGQRPMQNKLFSPIFDYILNEQMDEIGMKRLENDIRQKVSEFIPEIEIKKINFSPKPDENLLGVEIVFSIKEIGTTQTIELNVPLDETDHLPNR